MGIFSYGIFYNNDFVLGDFVMKDSVLDSRPVIDNSHFLPLDQIKQY